VELTIYLIKEKIFSEDKLESIYKVEINDYAWINTLKCDSLVVLAGSSSVRYGLSCTELNNLSSNSYKYANIANDARDPIQTYFIIKNLDFSNISAIYFGLDPWIYAKRYYMHRNKYMYLDFSFKETLNFSQEHDKSALLKRYKSFFKYVFNTYESSNYKNTTIPFDFGSVALEREAINFNEPASQWFQTDKYGWSDLQFTYLQKMSVLCQEKQVKFAVFLPPKRRDYCDIYKNNCASIHHEYVDKIVATGFNASILGRFDQLDESNDGVNFAEAYHLNKKGQATYSKLFYEMTHERMTQFSDKYSWFTN
jgi:hypothetical protein